MPRNTMLDLNDHLFEQMERLNEDNLTDKELAKECKRTKAMALLAGRIIDNAAVALKAERLKLEYGNREVDLPAMLEHKK